MDETKVVDLVAQLAGDESTIRRSSHLRDDLGFDSLDRAELGLQLEDAFEDITIPDDTAQGWQTVQDVVDSVATLLSTTETTTTEGGTS